MESIWDDISAGESRTLEFKEDFPKDSLKYVKTAVAFSNCQGGRIVFGVREDGVVVGIENPEMVADQAVDTISNMCTPEMSLTTYIETRDGRSIVVVNVPAGLGRPYHVKSKGKKNGTYVRVGAMTRIADDDWLMDLTLEGVRRSFDAERYVVKRVESGSEGILELCRYLSSRKLQVPVVPQRRTIRRDAPGQHGSADPGGGWLHPIPGVHDAHRQPVP